MKKMIFLYFRIVFAIFISVGAFRWDVEARSPYSPVDVQAINTPDAVCNDGIQSSGALYRICMPNSNWNGELVVYAHGYVAPGMPPAIPLEAVALSNLATFLGYGFATSSYSVNGLAVIPGMNDLVDLVSVFAAEQSEPTNVYLVGASEGGLITALSAEKYPDVYDGALATCAPYGDFQAQINYIGDFRVVFDYFFPGLMPDSPIQIPQSLIEDWNNHYATVIAPVINQTLTMTPTLISQLMIVTGTPYTPGETFTQTQNTIEGLLWYNVFATNNAVDVLGGQPFDNTDRDYSGSDDDTALNAGVARFSADLTALADIEANYQTSGDFTIPVVTLHTTQDEIVPYFHVPLYQDKILYPSIYTHFAVERYGHCMFTDTETLTAFSKLVELVATPNFPVYLPVALNP